MEALSNVQHKIFAKNIMAFASDLFKVFDLDLLERLLVYPLLRTEAGYVFAMTEFSSIEEIPEILGLQLDQCSFVYSTRSRILEAINHQGDVASAAYELISAHLETGAITGEQAVLAIDKNNFAPDILIYMGLKSIVSDKPDSHMPTMSENFSSAQHNYLNIC